MKYIVFSGLLCGTLACAADPLPPLMGETRAVVDSLPPVEMGSTHLSTLQKKLEQLESFIYKRFGREALDGDHQHPVTPAVFLEKLADVRKQVAQMIAHTEEVEQSNRQLKEQITKNEQSVSQTLQKLEHRVRSLEQFKTTSEEKVFHDRIQNLNDEELFAIAQRMKKENMPHLAENAFKLYIERYPQSKNIQDAYRHLMDIAYDQDRLTDAALLGAQSYKIDPHHPEITEVLFKMGHILKKLGKRAEALTTFQKIKSDYQNLSSHLNLRVAQSIHDLETENASAPSEPPTPPEPSLGQSLPIAEDSSFLLNNSPRQDPL